MSRLDRRALLLSGRCRLASSDPVVWLVDDRPATPDEAEVLADLCVHDMEAVYGLLLEDLAMQDIATLASVHGFMDSAQRFLRANPSWGVDRG